MITLPCVPSVQQYKAALERIADEITDKQKRLLLELLSAPNRTLTATELAQNLGYAHCITVNGQWGRLGHLLSDALDCLPEKREDGSYRWWSILSSGEKVGAQGFQWTMYPQLAQALEELEWE